MALILDTSALIGWVELKDDAVVEALREHSRDAAPRVHAVTIGELERVVAQASDEVTRTRRRATLRFAREQLAPLPLDSTGDQPEAFGQIAAAVSRKISHNDTWITASAVTEERTLLTQDADLATKTRAAAQADGPLRTWLENNRYALDIILIPRSTS